MKDTEFTVHAITDMYESLFYYFLGDNDSLLTKEACIRYPLSMYHKNNPQICPAKYLVVNALIKAVSPQQEELSKVNKEEWQKGKKKVSAYLSKSKLIDFEKLDDIYAKVRDRRLNPQQRVQVKEEILGIMDPQYLIAVHLYMKYHKIFDRELFDAFCGMIITEDIYPNWDIPSFCFAALSTGEELVAEVKEYIYGTNGKDKKAPKILYNEVYADFLSTAKEFPAIKVYQPEMEHLEAAISEVLKDVTDNDRGKRNKPKVNKNVKLFPATVKRYLGTLIKAIKTKVIINLDTKSGQGGDNQPNLRTIRSNSRKFTYRFRLAVPFGTKEQYANTIASCPDFLLGELWECLKQNGLKGKSDSKLKTEDNSLIDSERILLMGRLYMIVLLCYAFDAENYGRQENFKDIIENSLREQQVSDLLKAYRALTEDEADQEIITELLSKTSTS